MAQQLSSAAAVSVVGRHTHARSHAPTAYTHVRIVCVKDIGGHIGKATREIFALTAGHVRIRIRDLDPVWKPVNRRRMTVPRLLAVVVVALSLGGVDGGQQIVEGHVGKCGGGK